MSSHVSRLTRHCQGTPPNTPTLSLLGSLLFGLQLGLLRYPSITHTSNTFVPPIQWDVLPAFVRWQDAPSKESSRQRMQWAILTCIPNGVAFTLPEMKTYWTRSHRQPATSSASCDCHRRRLFIRPDGTYFTETCSRQTHDRTPSTRASCDVPLPSPVASADTNLSDPIIVPPSKMVRGAGQAIWKARPEGELSD